MGGIETERPGSENAGGLGTLTRRDEEHVPTFATVDDADDVIFDEQSTLIPVGNLQAVGTRCADGRLRRC
mgnify:CR=1 FL=1